MSDVQKWCGHCRKDNHNDSECWSTRAVLAEAPRHQFLSSDSTARALAGFKRKDSLIEALIAAAIAQRGGESGNA